jgi:hypothetical protein
MGMGDRCRHRSLGSGLVQRQKGTWGKTMKHFTTEEWIDFANQVVSGSKKREMTEHLEKGCTRCEETVSIWQGVRRTAGSVKKYEVPEPALRIAKAAFAGANVGQQRGGSASGLELLFDSFLRPAQAGARGSGHSGTRQMLYRAEPYQIDLHIEAKPGENRIVVIGQLLDTRQPDTPGGNVPVVISNLRGNAVHTVTNEFGEFREELQPSGDLELMITGENGKAVVISLRDALGRRTEGNH